MKTVVKHCTRQCVEFSMKPLSIKLGNNFLLKKTVVQIHYFNTSIWNHCGKDIRQQILNFKPLSIEIFYKQYTNKNRCCFKNNSTYFMLNHCRKHFRQQFFVQYRCLSKSETSVLETKTVVVLLMFKHVYLFKPLPNSFQTTGI
jgi:hypothetical protein